MSNTEFIGFLIVGMFGFVRIFAYFTLSSRILFKNEYIILFLEILNLLLTFYNLITTRNPTPALNFFMAICSIIILLFRRKELIRQKVIGENIVRFNILCQYNYTVLEEIFKLKKADIDKLNIDYRTDSKTIKKLIVQMENKDNINFFIERMLKKLNITLNKEELEKIEEVKKRAYKEYITNINKLKN